ncbi:adenylate/guanylate cyclase domain-containing protein [Nocardia sp. NPDC004568]|uniref:adenylate/guanylate cyclase domain-containing protein n=1 Tax=Nocardia sp. NPDC004568 TaxID=3154551 RepID=UPI0033A70E59
MRPRGTSWISPRGWISQFVDDAVMALFNAPTHQPGHALRAAGAGLALQRAVAETVIRHPGRPRFRVGVNTGPALVGSNKVLRDLQQRNILASTRGRIAVVDRVALVRCAR